MKKLMVVAMVAFATIAANAAKVTWGVADGTLAGVNSGTMYLVWAESADFSGLASMEKFDSSTIAAVGGTTVASTSYAGGAQTAETVVKPTTPISIGAGQKKLYTMIVSDDGAKFAYSPVVSQPILNNENTADISVAAGSYTIVPAAAAAPEPTSGLLLLLGVAGLALKRKRA